MGRIIRTSSLESGTGFDIDLTPNFNGRVWVIVLPSVSPYLNPTAAEIKNYAAGTASGAMGTDLTGCRINSGAITASTQLARTFTNCALSLGVTYTLYTYVTDTAAGDDGSIYPTTLDVPESNWFTTAPAIVADSIIYNGLTFTFTPYKTGRYWAIILTEGTNAAAHKGSVKAGTNALGHATSCRVTLTTPNSVHAGVQVTKTLSNCGMLAGETYKLNVYVEDSLDNGDGTLVVVDAVVPSNLFIDYPTVQQSSVTTNGFFFTFRPSANGMYW